MGKSNRKANISRRVKTSHKKMVHNKKIIMSKIDAKYKNIN